MASYLFGAFRLDPATRELRRGDAAIAVPPRAFDCIVYLVEHRDRAVGRDELIAAVWGKADIGDGMLGQTILSARRALEDTGKEQACIRTVIRFGYHWIAPVTVDGGEAAPTGDAGEPMHVAAPATAPRSDVPATATPSARSRDMRVFAIAVIVVVLLLAVALAWRLQRATITTAPASAANGPVALVLPVLVGAGSGHDWIRLGVMDLVATRLRDAGLAVIPSDNVLALLRRLGPASDNAAALAAAAAAGIVIEARADSSASSWRVQLRTVHGRSPPLLVEAEAPDVLAAARLAADRLARGLGLSPRAESALATSPDLATLLGQVDAAILGERLDEARTLLDGAGGEARDQPDVLLRIAQIDYQRGDFAAAERGFEAVARAAPAERDAVLHARALTGLGIVAVLRHDLADARRRTDAAINLLRSAEAPDALGKALNARGNVAGTEGRQDEALRYFAEARIAFEGAGDLLATAVVDSNLASVDMQRQRYAEAEQAFARAAARFAVFGVAAAELNALTAVAELRLALLQPDAALALEPRLRALAAEVPDPARRRAGELARLQVLDANGRERGLDEALRALLAQAVASSDRASLVGTHALVASRALERGDARGALAAAREATARLAPVDDARVQAQIRLLELRARLTLGEPVDATLAALDAFAIEHASPSVRAHAALAHALVAVAQRGDAATHFAHALAAADASRVPSDLRAVVVPEVEWLLGLGKVGEAATLGERLAGWVARDYECALLRLRIFHALGERALGQAELARVRALAGDRGIPAALLQEPPPATATH